MDNASDVISWLYTVVGDNRWNMFVRFFKQFTFPLLVHNDPNWTFDKFVRFSNEHLRADSPKPRPKSHLSFQVTMIRDSIMRVYDGDMDEFLAIMDDFIYQSRSLDGRTLNNRLVSDAFEESKRSENVANMPLLTIKRMLESDDSKMLSESDNVEGGQPSTKRTKLIS
jgi:hypothetical protein